MNRYENESTPTRSIEEELNNIIDEFLNGKIVGRATFYYESASELAQAQSVLEKRGFTPTKDLETNAAIKHWANILKKGKSVKPQHLSRPMDRYEKGLHCQTGCHPVRSFDGRTTRMIEKFVVVITGEYCLEGNK